MRLIFGCGAGAWNFLVLSDGFYRGRLTGSWLWCDERDWEEELLGLEEMDTEGLDFWGVGCLSCLVDFDRFLGLGLGLRDFLVC